MKSNNIVAVIMEITVQTTLMLIFGMQLFVGSQPVKSAVPSREANMPRDSRGATFVNTDGIQKICAAHSDCYDMREPIYWCRLASNQHWTEKGCYCDSVLRACIIERWTKLGPTTQLLNYAYCAPKKSWYCPHDNSNG